METALTLDAIRSKVLELAEANPDFVYESDRDDNKCVYIHEGPDGPVGGCIFGQALLSLGVSAETLMLADKEDESIAGLLKTLGLVGSVFESFPQRCNTVQDRQDTGYRWADAVDGLRYEDLVTA